MHVLYIVESSQIILVQERRIVLPFIIQFTVDARRMYVSSCRFLRMGV